MSDLLKSDAFTRTRMDRFTGEPRRQWLEYADGVIEPVRKEGNLNKKFHGNKRSLDWWTVEKPLDWDPTEQGRKVSLNHDYGRPERGADKQANAPKNRPVSTGLHPSDPSRTLLAMGGQAAEKTGEKSGTGKDEQKNSPDTPQENDRKKSWAYEYLVPPLWKPKGDPKRDQAEKLLKNELEEFAHGFLDLPDPIVSPIRKWGEIRKGKEE
jgi:hypothetical protein